MKAIRRLIAIIMAIAMITVSCICYATASGTRIPISTPTRVFGGQYMPMPASNYVDNIVGNAPYVDTNIGAYYYVYSGLSTTYSEAFANIKLPTSLNLANGTRHACISLGIAGDGVAIDLGLINVGNGWTPVYNEVLGTGGVGELFPEYTAPSTATNAKIVVKPVNSNTVHMYIQFLNASGQNVGTTSDRDITLEGSSFNSSGTYIPCQYYRFASLIPAGCPDNQSDGSYMIGGQFINLGLYNRNTSTYDTWGIETARVVSAYRVHPEHISLNYGSNYDTFNINHNG